MWTDGTDGDGYVDKDGQKLSIFNWLTYPTRLEQPKLAEYAQATLKDIGIDVVVNNTSDHMTIAKSGDFDVYVSLYNYSTDRRSGILLHQYSYRCKELWKLSE